MSEMVWVESDVHADGRYGITVRAGDVARGLSEQEALVHAAAVLVAVQRAEYDAATLSLLTSIGIDNETAVLSIQELRTARPVIDPEALAPLLLAPGVSAFTGKPFLTVMAGDLTVGQWSVDQARRHAVAALEVAEVVRLDQALFDWLVSEVDLDEGRARAVVHSIGEHR
jgi:hypothetical protein